MTACLRRHTRTDVLPLFKLIDLHAPDHLDLQVLLDKPPAPRRLQIKKWLPTPALRLDLLHPDRLELAPPWGSWFSQLD